MSTLFIVATPIGNLEDISLRALRTLKEVDFIICEDTRVTSKLLARYEIQKPLVSYFQHSKLSRIEEIADRLARGENAALVTDAGTPGISDPGGQLVHYIRTSEHQNINIVPLPGPCAAIAALCISGLPTDQFTFMGFPPHKKGRQTFWKKVAASQETVVFYESPHRIIKALEQLREVLIDPSPQSSPTRGEEEKTHKEDGEKRQLVVCRELTKMFESVYRGTIDEIAEKVQKDPIKGEYVVVIGR
ncbi:MAG: 16S rRNA (cytidine(1402)-2'-O)-methyltransferase [bacterium]|nr:16S rRNA (cytidine(1402)-2'-O)-methyltransferase [bacterium]